MANKRHRPEEIVSKLRQVDVLREQGLTTADAIRPVGSRFLTDYQKLKTVTAGPPLPLFGVNLPRLCCSAIGRM